MRILLLAPPDFTPFLVGATYPTLGICSLAANVEGAQVSVLDLQRVDDVDATLKRLMIELDPDLVGISAMTFLYPAAADIAGKLKALKPRVKTVLGGYHATTAYRSLARTPEARRFDFLLRGEGERSFDMLVQALKCGDERFDRIPGLCWHRGGELVCNPQAEQNLDLSRIALPARHKRLVREFYGWGERLDLIETSRGCTKPCSYCSIRKMYGRSYRAYDIDRVIEDVLIMRSQGVKQVAVADDNITLDVPRLKRLCQRLIEDRIQLRWQVQATVEGIASDPELSELMAKAGFYQVYLGIERLDKGTLTQFKKGRGADKTMQAVENLRRCGIQVFGGFIIGAPDDDRSAIEELVEQIRIMDLDVPHIGILVPLPETELTEELLEQGLVTNLDDYGKYSYDYASVRTRHLSSKELLRLRNWAHARLYLDPRTRAGRHFYKQLRKPYVPRTLYGFMRQTISESLASR